MVTEIVLGIGVGIVLGLTGSGGVLAVPALMLGLGFSLQAAAPVALIAVGLSSLIGTIHGLRMGIVRYRAAAIMALAGIACSPLGIYLSHRLPTEVLTLLFSVLLLFIAVRMARQAWQKNSEGLGDELTPNCLVRADTGRFQLSKKCVATFISIGGLSGLSSGLLGVGGGFLIVPGVRQFSNLKMHSIVATSLAVITLISTGTVINALLAGARLSGQAWWFIGSTVIGLLIGRAVAPLLSGRVLQLGFSVMATITALMLINKYLLPMLF
ncbi:sulfite exporter TauE/SafE family protein [Halioxenophilus sp. WMMB6]|uniref:sulfite exporter TauE/SafE family protein n=1 Tax=Halioxenophilus sp. WMMB6 TaxID=3073815 RepID=UPI00295EDDEF|nr:sulfite exporter TauE/SafE family protein [Halioxenophilus sp. WMMB6]